MKKKKEEEEITVRKQEGNDFPQNERGGSLKGVNERWNESIAWLKNGA